MSTARVDLRPVYWLPESRKPLVARRLHIPYAVFELVPVPMIAQTFADKVVKKGGAMKTDAVYFQAKADAALDAAEGFALWLAVSFAFNIYWKWDSAIVAIGLAMLGYWFILKPYRKAHDVAWAMRDVEMEREMADEDD